MTKYSLMLNKTLKMLSTVAQVKSSLFGKPTIKICHLISKEIMKYLLQFWECNPCCHCYFNGLRIYRNEEKYKHFCTLIRKHTISWITNFCLLHLAILRCGFLSLFQARSNTYFCACIVQFIYFTCAMIMSHCRVLLLKVCKCRSKLLIHSCICNTCEIVQDLLSVWKNTTHVTILWWHPWGFQVSNGL